MKYAIVIIIRSAQRKKILCRFGDSLAEYLDLELAVACMKRYRHA